MVCINIKINYRELTCMVSSLNFIKVESKLISININLHYIILQLLFCETFLTNLIIFLSYIVTC